MSITKPYSKWSLTDKKNFGKDAISYAKEAGLSLKKRKTKKSK
ncbi:hypothetical protein [Paenibacillus sp. FSL A5-0031]|nr:hypothetical protein [Paenibacillus sp. FSL A5-0031]